MTGYFNVHEVVQQRQDALIGGGRGREEGIGGVLDGKSSVDIAGCVCVCACVGGLCVCERVCVCVEGLEGVRQD